MSVIIIAEAGVNHNGELDKALELVDIAAHAGADYVKFQTFNADELAVENSDKALYQKESEDDHQSQKEMLSKLQLSNGDYDKILERCRIKKINFLSTAFDIKSMQFLQKLGIGIIKIPSGEITNEELLEFAGRLALPIILSTGMSSLGEVEYALSILLASGAKRSEITIMHCTSAYPAPMTDVNLAAITTLKNAFHTNVGYSDHTLGIEVSIAAVAFGATIIEKHFTIDKNLNGPDHAASLAPYELFNLVQKIRNIELAIGSGIKEIKHSEIETKTVARRSIVARCNIEEGECYTDQNVTLKRPSNGLPPYFMKFLIGKKAKRSYSSDEIIEL
jgi:N,N'-diacetyllegionaminate synthase